jgi:hypothetical protein
MSLWLYNVLGGLWCHLFGGFGIIGFRVAGALLQLSFVFVTWSILRKYIPSKHLLLGVFVALIYIFKMNSAALPNYNSMTTIFLLLFACFIVRGLTQKNHLYILLSAAIMGFGIFVRLPNILGVFCFLLVIYYAYLQGWPLSATWRALIVYGLGYFAAVAAAILIMHLLGHLDLFLTDANRLLQIFIGKTDSLYQSDKMIKKLLRQCLYTLFITGVSLPVSFVLSKMIAKYTDQYQRITIIFTILLLGLLSYTFYGYHSYMVFGWINLIVLIHIFNIQKSDPDYRLVCLTGYVIFLISFMGSSSGITNFHYNAWLVIPICVNYVLKVEYIDFDIQLGVAPQANYRLQSSLKSVQIWKGLVFGSVIVFSLLVYATHTYRDAECRLEMTASIDHPLTRFVYTTPQRARAVEEVLNAVERLEGQYDYLLATPNVPMLHYLTGKPPYLRNAWPNLFQDDRFFQELELAQKRSARLPLILLASCNTRDSDWPVPDPAPPALSRHNPQMEALAGFMRRHGYRSVWSNECFSLHTPQKSL